MGENAHSANLLVQFQYFCYSLLKVRKVAFEVRWCYCVVRGAREKGQRHLLLYAFLMKTYVFQATVP